MSVFGGGVGGESLALKGCCGFVYWVALLLVVVADIVDGTFKGCWKYWAVPVLYDKDEGGISCFIWVAITVYCLWFSLS